MLYDYCDTQRKLGGDRPDREGERERVKRRVVEETKS